MSSNNDYTATNEVNGLMLLVIAQDLPDMSILRLAGRIVQGDDSTALLNAVMCRQRKQPIVLDLAEVNTVDAHGLGVLAFLYKWARDNGIDFKIANAKAHVRDVLALTKLDSVLEVLLLERFGNGRGCKGRARPARSAVLAPLMRELSFQTLSAAGILGQMRLSQDPTRGSVGFCGTIAQGGLFNNLETLSGWGARAGEFNLHAALTKKTAGIAPALFSFYSDELRPKPPSSAGFSS